MWDSPCTYIFLPVFVFPFPCSFMQFLMWVWELCDMLQLPYGAKVLNLSVFCIKSQLKNPICCLIWLLQRQCCFSNQLSNNITFVMGGIQFASEITGKKVCRNLVPVALCAECTRMRWEGCSVTPAWELHPVPWPAPQGALHQEKQQDALLWHQESAESRADNDAKWWPCGCLIRGPVPRHLLI